MIIPETCETNDICIVLVKTALVWRATNSLMLYKTLQKYFVNYKYAFLFCKSVYLRY